MEIGDKVQIINPTQINYPSQGTVVDTDNDKSKVSFRLTEVWFNNKDLIKIG